MNETAMNGTSDREAICPCAPVAAREESRPSWHEECGIFGIWSRTVPVTDACYLGLFALQHRGQESAGIAVTDGIHVDIEKGMGLMTEAFKPRLPGIRGHCAIGHVRYSTVGGSVFANVQPFLAAFSGGFISLAHNGSLTNAQKVRRRLESEGCVFQSTSDSEAILNLIAISSAPTVEDKILSSLEQIEGAYSLIIMTGEGLIGVRDPHAFRPLCLGRLEDGYVLASETCALDAVNATFVRDVLPGEMVVVDQNGVHSRFLQKKAKLSSCVFEYIYFARPDSVIDGTSVWQARYLMGRRLAREYPVSADVVVPVPDTGIAAAIGFSAESGVPWVEGLIKNRYVGRTFILPDQTKRRATVEMKLNPVRANLEGKRVVMIDDSIVRGTTSARLVALLRRAGATEVHMCVSSPPITHPCYYGIDTSIRKELIAAVSTEREIGLKIGTDGLHYLSLQGLLESVGDAKGERMCTSCFHGIYPTDVSECLVEAPEAEGGGEVPKGQVSPAPLSFKSEA
ncbi:MAG: amidophosphoribosyltransferase [Synergistaceae bacterium]|jgi:amidophosphoribosyltransferase|nr:amidophosphoribosyltransferase [Synergistaceae bacterium]